MPMRVRVVLCLALLAMPLQALPYHPDHPAQLLMDLLTFDGGFAAQSSSYDRTGGNNDGFDGSFSALRERTGPQGTEYVVMEANRPGILGNIWFTGDVDDDPQRRIRFYFDGENEPRIDMQLLEFFSGNIGPFPHPLAAPNTHSSGGFVCAVTIPWAKSLIVATTKRQKFFHFTYRTFYALPAGMTTFDPRQREQLFLQHPQVLQTLARPATVRLADDSARVVSRRVTIAPGKSAEAAKLAGAGMIVRIELSAHSSDEQSLRRSMLKMFWDGESDPSVEAPIGDFFGCPFGLEHFETVPYGSTAGGFYCNWPMPFAHGARAVVDNGSLHSPLTVDLHLYVVDAPAETLQDDSLRFHAMWHRVVTEHGKPHLILTARGRGHYVGVSMGMQGIGFGFMEGDEQIFIDGETTPSIHGTGTEDYFNGGWYFDRGPFQLPYHGVTVKDESKHRIAAYRLHVPDPIPFHREIRVQIEHGPANDMAGSDYASVAFWYQTEPHGKPFDIPPAAQIVPALHMVRTPGHAIAAETLMQTARGRGATVLLRPWIRAHNEYSGGQQLLLAAARPGQGLAIEINAPARDRYHLVLGLSRGPDYGPVEILLNGRRIGETIDAYQEAFEPSREIALGPVLLPAGSSELFLRVLPSKRPRYVSDVGIHYLTLTSASQPIAEYMVIGPFPLASLEETAAPLPAETPLEFNMTYSGINDHPVAWRLLRTDANGVLNLHALAPDKDNVVALCYAAVWAPTALETTLLLGSDDSVVVLINGEPVLTRLERRGLIPDRDAVAVHLNAGWNDLLFKIGDAVYEWGLTARLVDPEGVLRYAARPD